MLTDVERHRLIEVVSRNEDAVASVKSERVLDSVTEVGIVLHLGSEEVDGRGRHVRLIIIVTVPAVVVVTALDVLTSVHLLTVHVGNESDVHEAFNDAKQLLLLNVVRSVEQDRALIQLDALQLSNVVIEGWDDNIVEELAVKQVVAVATAAASAQLL